MLDEILDTLSAPRKFLWGMVPGLHDADTGEAYTGSQAVSNAFGMDPDSPWTHALGFGAEVLGDPLPLLAGAGMRLGKAALGAGRAVSGAMRGGETVAPLLAKGRNFTTIRDFAPLAGGDFEGSMLGKSLAGQDEGLVRKMFDQASNGFAGTSGGAYFPDVQTAILPKGAPYTTLRHEMTHGLIGDAARTGDTSGLGMIGRASANLQRTPFSFTQGLGEIANEMAAYGAESRGALPQAGNALKFLFSPRQGYVEQFARTSPLAAQVYAHSPQIAGLGAGLGAGAAGLGAYQYLSR